jgi:hypothetical protein
MNRHFMFRKQSKLISYSDFSLKGNDVVINIDRFGKIDIDESRFSYDNDHNKGWDKDNNGWDKNNRGRDGDSRDYGRNDHSKDFGRNDHNDSRNRQY